MPIRVEKNRRLQVRFGKWLKPILKPDRFERCRIVSYGSRVKEYRSPVRRHGPRVGFYGVRMNDDGVRVREYRLRVREYESKMNEYDVWITRRRCAATRFGN